MKTKFQVPNLYYQVYGNMVEENIIDQALQEICRGKFVIYNVFRVSLGKFGQNIFAHSKIACSYTYGRPTYST